MTIYLGKGEDPTEFLTQARSGQVAPGETAQVIVPFELPALSFGSYTARTVIDGLDQQGAVLCGSQTSHRKPPDSLDVAGAGCAA